MRVVLGPAFQRLLTLLVVALLALLSGYAAAASHTGHAARAPQNAVLEVEGNSSPLREGGENTYSQWVNFILRRLLAAQGALDFTFSGHSAPGDTNEELPAITMGRPLSGTGNYREAELSAIGPSASAPINQSGEGAQLGAVGESENVAGVKSWTPILYQVKEGETLSEIARRHGVKPATLIDVNALGNPDLLKVGQLLVIPPVDGRFYEVRQGDVLWAISDRFGVNIGTIVDANAIDDPSVLQPGQVLFIPYATGRSVATAAVASTRGGGFAPRLSWPLTVKGWISSPYGYRRGSWHTGVDIAVPHGTAIVAAAAGRVQVARWLGAYGRAVVIVHPESGWKTLYAHASRLLVQEGDWVSAGQKIAYAGSTGRSTGPHLHFEVIIDGKPRDPLRYVKPD